MGKDPIINKRHLFLIKSLFLFAKLSNITEKELCGLYQAKETHSFDGYINEEKSICGARPKKHKHDFTCMMSLYEPFGRTIVAEVANNVWKKTLANGYLQ